jgi:preprotein translocase subunit YajC
MDITSLFIPLLFLVLLIPIFLSARRQRKQVAEQQALQTALQVGDYVMTTSGLRGTVTDTSYEDTVDIEIADGVVTTWLRAAVREKITTPDEVETTDPVDDEIVVEEPSPEIVSVDKPVVQDADPTTDKPAGKATVDAPSLQKDDSTNGSTRA